MQEKHNAGSHNHCDCCHEEHGCDCGHAHHEREKWVEPFIIGLSVVCLVLSFLGLGRPYYDPAWIVIVLCGKDIFLGAVRGLKKGKITSSLLVSVAMLASIVLEIFGWFHVENGNHGESYLFAAGEIAFLMFLGEWLEERTVRKSKSGVAKLATLLPETARVNRNGQWVNIVVKELKIGDRIEVRSDEKIAADGVVVQGESAVDNSLMTGESMRVDVKNGDFVYGGAWNGQGVLQIEVTKAPEDMAVAHMIRLTQEAQGKKAPIARLADRWAGILVPMAALLALLVFAGAYYGLKVPFTQALVRGVSVLVVFCPCALTLATPTSISAAIGAFSKQGVLVKTGGAIEQLASVRYMAFDKTGTLTEGSLKITDYAVLSGTKQEFFDLLKTVESASEHPIAKAIQAYEKGIVLPCAQQQATRGVGVSCVVGGDKIEAVKAAHMQDTLPERWKSEGKTVIELQKNELLLGYVALSDSLRAEAKSAVERLTKQGVQSVMLTGDNGGAAAYIAEKAGITKVEHSLMPEQKTEIVERFKGMGKTVFVGDGVNDTPALATADVGISMSVLGSDIATQNADIALFTEDLNILPWLLKCAKKILFTIKGNIIFAMTVNVAAVLLSLFGFLSPAGGALLHNGVSVLVVLNSCRLLRMKRK